MSDLYSFLKRAEYDYNVFKKIKHTEAVEDYYRPKHLIVNGVPIKQSQRVDSLMSLLEKTEKSEENSSSAIVGNAHCLSYQSLTNFSPFKHLYRSVRVFKVEKQDFLNFNWNLKASNLDLILVFKNNWMILCHQIVLANVSKLISDELAFLYQKAPSRVKCVDLTMFSVEHFHPILIFIEYVYCQKLMLLDNRMVSLFWTILGRLKISQASIEEIRRLLQNLNIKSGVSNMVHFPGRDKNRGVMERSNKLFD